MSSALEKLNLRQQQEIPVVNAPSSFEPELLALSGVTVLRDPKRSKVIHFAFVFATQAVFFGWRIVSTGGALAIPNRNANSFTEGVESRARMGLRAKATSKRHK